ncbi:hypothetical protein [Nitrosophilus labii]|uniref:hypothetical protein n=1 Tax=Nitrosophilus labii TaxID=2706014 RepID=UPI001656900D|nr:hypothetical protein [Nitrosophilus labii]
MKKDKLDLSKENIKKLHDRCKMGEEDLYTFLKKEFLDMIIEDRLKYLATVLNDHFEDYEFDKNAERISDEGYSIVKFFPKKDRSI